jgi:hypothetical protein
MTSIMEMMQQHLGDDGVSQLSQHLGVDRGTTEAAVAAALPMLVNAASKTTAPAAGGPAGGPAGGLLSNLFGGNHSDAAQQVSKHSGLDMHQAEKALLFLAPLVMARLMNQGQSGGTAPAAPASPASPTGTAQPAPEPQQSGLGGVLGAVERIFHKER